MLYRIPTAEANPYLIRGEFDDYPFSENASFTDSTSFDELGISREG